MKKIYKWEIANNSIEAPKYVKFLTAQWQESSQSIVVWGEIDTEDDEDITETFVFEECFTGHEYYKGRGQYLATVQVPHNGLVIHIYYKPTSR